MQAKLIVCMIAILPIFSASCAAEKNQAPTVTNTIQANWVTLKESENIAQDTSWECIPNVTRENGKLIITAEENYNTALNMYGPCLKVSGDFGISVDFDAIQSVPAALALYGVLPHQKEWWQGIKRIDVGINNNQVIVNIWDGTKDKPLLTKLFRIKDAEPKMKLGLRKIDKQFVILADGLEVGRVEDQNIFAEGMVYFGTVAAPKARLAISSFSVEVQDSNPKTAQLVSMWSIRSPKIDQNNTGTSLRSLGRTKGIMMGADVDSIIPLISDAKYRETLAREYHILTPGNAMKFMPIHPSRHRYSFCAADILVAFAKTNDIRIHGHTLVWHNQLPAWLTDGNYTRTELKEILRDHIFTVVRHFKGKILLWDVVNEAVADNGLLRDTIWLRTIGPEYIDLAFQWAHEADPEALLFYNDYGGEGLGRKSDAIFTLVRGMKQRGVPMNGVGLQMHVSLDNYPRAQVVAANMKRLAEIGLQVQVTEMDVRIKGEVTDSKLADQARIYREILEVCLSNNNCSAFTTWGFTDKHSWIPDFFPGYGGALVFDESYLPKPAYNALRDVLSNP